jgi:myo-inositol 2-dehydrogenase / D-chiro-inositol 1-dehydrogenase
MRDIYMKKIKIGVVGLGRLGIKHAENVAFRIPNAELIAVCSIIEDEVIQAKKEWGIFNGYTDYYEMIQNKELDAVLIASSSSEHCKHIEAALKAGLHVFCEKPLGINMEECIAAEKIVEAYPDKVFMLGFMRRYDDSYYYAKKKIEEGCIGNPIMVRAYGLDPEALVEGAIRFARTSGGIFLDMAIHDIDLARWFLSANPVNVYAIGGSYVHKEFDEFGDCDNACAIMQFDNRSMAMFYAGRTAPHGYHIETEIVGTKGTLRISAVPQKNLVTVFDSNGAVQECVSGFIERFGQAYLNEVQAFVSCILENKKPDVTVYDGTWSTKAAFAATESFRKNILIKI